MSVRVLGMLSAAVRIKSSGCTWRLLPLCPLLRLKRVDEIGMRKTGVLGNLFAQRSDWPCAMQRTKPSPVWMSRRKILGLEPNEAPITSLEAFWRNIWADTRVVVSVSSGVTGSCSKMVLTDSP